jgi:hypothetical protein
MKETAIKAANFILSIYLLKMIDTLFLRPSLHFFPFKLHPTTLHHTLLPSHLA